MKKIDRQLVADYVGRLIDDMDQNTICQTLQNFMEEAYKHTPPDDIRAEIEEIFPEMLEE